MSCLVTLLDVEYWFVAFGAQERNLMLRERSSNYYPLSSYYMAKTLVDSTAGWATPIVFVLITYFAIGFQYTAPSFFLFLLFFVLQVRPSVACSVGLGLLVNTWFHPPTTVAVNCLPVVLCKFFVSKCLSFPMHPFLLCLHWKGYYGRERRAVSVVLGR